MSRVIRSVVRRSTDEPLEQPWFGGPRFEQDVALDLAGGVAEGQGDDDDIVERADDGEELGDEVDGREDPEACEADGESCSAWDAGVLAEPTGGRGTGGEHGGKVLGGTGWQPPGEQQEHGPRGDEQSDRDEKDADQRRCQAASAVFTGRDAP